MCECECECEYERERVREKERKKERKRLLCIIFMILDRFVKIINSLPKLEADIVICFHESKDCGVYNQQENNLDFWFKTSSKKKKLEITTFP